MRGPMTFNHMQTRQVGQGTLLAGNSRYAIASELKIAPKTVYNIVEKLVHGGYIRHRIPYPHIMMVGQALGIQAIFGTPNMSFKNADTNNGA